MEYWLWFQIRNSWTGQSAYLKESVHIHFLIATISNNSCRSQLFHDGHPCYKTWMSSLVVLAWTQNACIIQENTTSFVQVLHLHSQILQSTFKRLNPKLCTVLGVVTYWAKLIVCTISKTSILLYIWILFCWSYQYSQLCRMYFKGQRNCRTVPAFLWFST